MVDRGIASAKTPRYTMLGIFKEKQMDVMLMEQVRGIAR